MNMKELVYTSILLFIFIASSSSEFENDDDVPMEKLTNQIKKLEDIKNLKSITFGSCSDQNQNQILWPLIEKRRPDLWIWLGDTIYADRRKFKPTFPFIYLEPATPPRIKEGYKKLLSFPGYRSLVNSTSIVGVWDDHDFGRNDGGKTFEYRIESQQIFLDFIGEPKTSKRRVQEGVYSSYDIDEKVKVILLDVRYNRDDYSNVETGDFLGEKQWIWLENELRTSTASFHIIGSGIQILPVRKLGENWSRFPATRNRLLRLLLKYNPSGLVLLSGDVHFAEVNQIRCNKENVIFTEITSSGMTHSWKKMRTIPFLPSIFFSLLNHLVPFDHRPKWDAYYGGLNFGEMVFNFQGDIPVMSVHILGEDGKIHLTQEILGKKFIYDEIPSVDQCTAVQESNDWYWYMTFLIFCSCLSSTVFLLCGLSLKVFLLVMERLCGCPLWLIPQLRGQRLFSWKKKQRNE